MARKPQPEKGAVALFLGTNETMFYRDLETMSAPEAARLYVDILRARLPKVIGMSNEGLDTPLGKPFSNHLKSLTMRNAALVLYMQTS